MADVIKSILQAGERCLIVLERDGNTTCQEVTALVTGIPTLPDFKQDFDPVVVGGRRRLYRHGPLQAGELVLDVIMTDHKWQALRYGWAATGNPAAGVAAEEIRTTGIDTTGHYAPMMRVSVWIFEGVVDTAGSSGQNGPPATLAMQRYILKDCFAIELSGGADFGENLVKGTITFRSAPYDELGYANFFSEYTTAQSTTALTNLESTTVAGTAHGGVLKWHGTTTGWVSGYT